MSNKAKTQHLFSPRATTQHKLHQTSIDGAITVYVAVERRETQNHSKPETECWR